MTGSNRSSFCYNGRTFWVRPVGSWVLQSNNVVAEALAVSLDKPLEWAVGFFFGNVELSLELWTVISGISGLHDWDTDRTPSNVVTDYRVSLQSVTMWLRSPKEKFGFELV